MHAVFCSRMAGADAGVQNHANSTFEGYIGSERPSAPSSVPCAAAPSQLIPNAAEEPSFPQPPEDTH